MNIGIDIVDCDRVGGLVNEKIFSAEEIAYIRQKNNALSTIAGLFAAKEAFFKARGTGIIKSEMPKVVIGHRTDGQPFYVNFPQSTLSISHTKTTAVAVCIIF